MHFAFRLFMVWITGLLVTTTSEPRQQKAPPTSFKEVLRDASLFA